MELNQESKQMFIVSRDGQLDSEHYDAVYAERRKAALQLAGHEIVQKVIHSPTVAGKAILWLLTPDALRA